MTIVSFVLGWVACLSSLVLLVICMEAKDDDFIARVRSAHVVVTVFLFPKRSLDVCVVCCVFTFCL